MGLRPFSCRCGTVYRIDQHRPFFSENFTWCVLAVAFFTIVFDAARVALSTAGPPAALEVVTYRCGLFAILLVVCAVAAMMAQFVGLFVYSLIVTFRTRATYDGRCSLRM